MSNNFDSGVWGQTPLMDNILCGPIHEISKPLEHSLSLRGRKCFGQTAAHVAVLRADVLSMLVQTFSTSDVANIDEKTRTVTAFWLTQQLMGRLIP